MANGTAEVMTPDGDADEERGLEMAWLHANFMNQDGTLRTTDDDPVVPLQRSDFEDLLTEQPETEQPQALEGGKALYGSFGRDIRFAGGLSVKAALRGRDVINLRRSSGAQIGRQATLRVFPGGR